MQFFSCEYTTIHLQTLATPFFLCYNSLTALILVDEVNLTFSGLPQWHL